MSEEAKTFTPAFYSHRSVFITGGTGFIGKALCEKLLRSCPDIKEIFLLIRPHKNLTINDKLKKMLDNKVFDTLRSERPSSFDKLIPISGDITAKDLGLLPNDRQLLIERVSIIFHIAAIVRFDENLSNIILSNMRATRDICILAQSMKNIVALVYVSSTYTQSDKFVADEVLYPLDVDWRQTIKIAESVDEEILKIFTAKYIGTMANTYVFTKRLAEQIISDYSESLPCIIVRPSVVVSSVKEPLPGWSDNMNGPMGLNVGGGTGLLRTMYIDPYVILDLVPVDLVIRVILIVSWKRGIRSISEDNSLHIYNCTIRDLRCISLGEMIRSGQRVFRDIPFERTLWKPSVIMTKSRSLYYLLVMILHILPALFIDVILKIFGINPMLFRLQRRVYVTNRAVSFFIFNYWQFNNTNCLSVFENLSADHEKEFGYKELLNSDMTEYMKNSAIGYKIYLLNEDMNRLEQARRHFKRLEWLDRIIKILFVIIVWYSFYSRL